MGTLGSGVFGDKVNLYNGGLEFVQNDVSLPGNNALPVSVGRRLVVGQEPANNTQFGGWDLEVPHLHGIFARERLWTAGLGTNPALRCSAFGVPEGFKASTSEGSWNATEFWHGSFLYIPGAGDQEMLARNPSYTQAPGSAPATYPVVTRNNWSFRCLPGMAAGNSNSGEAFIAISPEGTQYRFDWMVSRNLTELSKSSLVAESTRASPPGDSGSNATTPPPSPDVVQIPFLHRSEVWILPTVVTDRFGNTVTYTYDPTNQWQLKTIVSNDASGSPRTLTLTYCTPGSTSSNLISSVTDGTRIWTYTYDNAGTALATLRTVTQPDGASWQLGGITPLVSNIQYYSDGGCDIPGQALASTISGYMVHPSGARGDFAGEMG